MTATPRKAGKPDTNFLTCEKNRIRLLIGHTIFFTSNKNRMTNEIASHQRETIFIEFVLTKSQYLYNNTEFSTSQSTRISIIS